MIIEAGLVGMARYAKEVASVSERMWATGWWGDEQSKGQLNLER